MREIFVPSSIRVWRDSSTKVHPRCFSQRRSSLAFMIDGNHLWLRRQINPVLRKHNQT